MSEKIYPVSAEWAQRAFINEAKYKEMYARSVSDPDEFWGEQGKRIDWMTPFTKVKNTSFDPHNVSIKWYEDGVTNAAYNCVDRHLPKRANQTAIIFEGDDPSDSRHITYQELHEQVCRFANVLKAHGVKKGDRVTIYLPMIPEAAYAMLACARIGAAHSVVFGGFSPDSLAGRIEDASTDVLITADEGLRGGRKVPLKANADAAAEKAPVKTMVVVKRTGGQVDMKPGRDVWFHEEAGMPARAHECGRSAVHPLYLRLHRQAQGRRAHDRRLSRLRLHDPPICLRLPRGRRLLVHGRCGLGDRPQLHSLRAPRQWRDHPHVRGRAELSQ
jgi:acetyl-CoA synthetase